MVKKKEIKVVEITKSFGITVNMAEYEFARYDVGMKARIEGMDLKEANKQLKTQVLNALEKDYGDMAEMATKLLKEQ